MLRSDNDTVVSPYFLPEKDVFEGGSIVAIEAWHRACNCNHQNDH